MDYVALFNKYKVPYSTHVNKGWVNANCPYCDTKKDSFNMGFNPVEDYCNCWKCGNHDLYDSLALLLKVPRRDLRQILPMFKGRGKGVLPSDKRRTYNGSLELPTNEFTEGERRYLEKRGFDADFLHEKYGVVGGGFTKEWHHRIIIPLYNDGELVSWVGRSILSSDAIKEMRIPRYKNLSIEKSRINPKDILFNLDNCVGDEVVLTEGCFDVMRLGDNFVCSLGTQLTQSQIRILCDRFRKVYIMFDNEEEAQDKARRYGMELASMGLDVEVVDAYSEYGVNDGGDCNDKQVDEIRKELGFRSYNRGRRI